MTLTQIQTEAREKFMDAFCGYSFNAPTRLNLMEFNDSLIATAYQLGKDAATREINQGMFDLLKDAGREDIIQKALEQARSV